MHFLEIITEYIAFIIFLITKMISKPKLQVSAIFGMFFVFTLYKNVLSKKAIEKTFVEDYMSLVEENSILKNVMQYGLYAFSGDDIEATNFFIQIGLANNKIAKMPKYKDKIKIYQFVINDKPSNPYQLNGIYENDINIKNSISSKTQEQVDRRFATMITRRELYLDSDLDTKCISIYCQEGVNHHTFLENIIKYNGKLIGKQVKCESIRKENKGQVIIVKLLKTNSFLMFREIGGDQAHKVGNSNHLKLLVFDNLNKKLFHNKNDLRKHDDKLYNLMEEFKLFSIIEI